MDRSLFQFTGKNRSLADGRHVVTVESSDWLGNLGKESYSLTVDNTLPPIKLPGDTSTSGQNGRGGKGGGGFGGGGGGAGGDGG